MTNHLPPPSAGEGGPIAEAPWHYGSYGTAECGADEPNMKLTMVAAHVTCPVCRGWLPIVAPAKAAVVMAAPAPAGGAPE